MPTCYTHALIWVFEIKTYILEIMGRFNYGPL